MPSSAPHPEHPSLSEVTAAPDYFARVSEAVLKIQNAPNLPAVLTLLHEAVARVGADVGAFLSFVEDDTSKTFRFLLDCDPQWSVEYERHAWYDDDPWFRYARLHAEPVRGHEITAQDESQRAIAHLAERFGFCSTVILPAPASGGLTRLGMLSIGSRTAGYFDGEGFAAVSVAAGPLAISLQDWCARDARDELLRTSRLTPQDLLLLRCEWEGLGTKKIASVSYVDVARWSNRTSRGDRRSSGLPRVARRRLRYGINSRRQRRPSHAVVPTVEFEASSRGPDQRKGHSQNLAIFWQWLQK